MGGGGGGTAPCVVPAKLDRIKAVGQLIGQLKSRALVVIRGTMCSALQLLNFLPYRRFGDVDGILIGIGPCELELAQKFYIGSPGDIVHAFGGTWTENSGQTWLVTHHSPRSTFVMR